MEVQFFFLSKKVNLKERKRLKQFISEIFKQNGHKLFSLNYIFCTDGYLLDINKAYLRHDYYTDIITFGFSETVEPVQGEIYISTDRVKDNARQMGVSVNEELHRVIFHGALHLCGYSDKKKQEQRQMREAEDKLLQNYFKRKRFHVKQNQ